MQPQHLALMIVINIIWGFTFVAGKWGVEHFPPFLFTGLRFLMIAAVLVPFIRIQKGQMKYVFAIAMFMGALHFAAFYGGMALAGDVSVIAVAIQLSVPFSTIMSVLFLGEVIGWKRTFGITLAFSGVVVMSFDPRVFQYIDAVGLATLAALMGAIATIFMKRIKDVGVFQLQGWIALISFPVLFSISAIVEADHWTLIQTADWKAWSGVIYTAIGASLVGHAGMYFLLRRYEVTQTAPLTLLGPIFGVIFGITIQGDILTMRMAIGAAIALSGCLIIAIRKKELVDAGP